MNIYQTCFISCYTPHEKIIELNLKMGSFKIRDSKNSTTEMVEIADPQRKTNGLTVPNYCGTTCQYYFSVLEGNVDTENCHIWKLFFQTVISRAYGQKWPYLNGVTSHHFQSIIFWVSMVSIR